ncbi:MAG: hypothetical protein WB948_15530 [Desulfobaccales bacterium]
MDYLRKTKDLVLNLGASSLIFFVAAIVLITVILIALFNFIESKALIGFVGVIIGSVISASTAVIIAKEDYRGKLALAALDKRIDVHQVAYALWLEIVGAVNHTERISDIVLKSQEFWKNNCLYLDAKSRKAFRDCYIFAFNHREMLDGVRNEETKRLIKESWDIIMKPGTTLVEGVSLPSLGGDESDYSR